MRELEKPSWRWDDYEAVEFTITVTVNNRYNDIPDFPALSAGVMKEIQISFDDKWDHNLEFTVESIVLTGKTPLEGEE